MGKVKAISHSVRRLVAVIQRLDAKGGFTELEKADMRVELVGNVTALCIRTEDKARYP